MENIDGININSCLLIICPGCCTLMNKCKFVEHCENECVIKEMQCLNKSLGCPAVINVTQMRNHLDTTCKFKLKNEVCLCGRNELESHFNSQFNMSCINHCSNCISSNNNCKDITNCPIINCTNCQVKLHQCKLRDHMENICQYQIIPCISLKYGCTIRMPRHLLAKHLQYCVASVVSCSREWTRDIHGSKLYQLSLDECNGGFSSQSNGSEHLWKHLNHKIYLRANQLITRDMLTGLTLRDQLYLCSSLNNNVKVQMNDSDVARLPNKTDSQMMNRKHSFPMLSCLKFTNQEDVESMDSEPKMLDCPISICNSLLDSHYLAYPLDDHSKFCDQESIFGENELLPLLDDRNWRVQHLTIDQKKPLGTYTFQCRQPVLRSEWEGHWRQHCDISAQLDDWIEIKCPLAYLGCKFCVSRFSKKHSQLAYHPLLDTYCQRFVNDDFIHSNNNMSILLQLPFEILLLVCSFLDGSSLFHVSRAHPRLKEAVNTVRGKRCATLDWYRNTNGYWATRVVLFRPISFGSKEVVDGNLLTKESIGAINEHLKNCMFKGTLSCGPDTPPFSLHSISKTLKDTNLPDFLRSDCR